MVAAATSPSVSTPGESGSGVSRGSGVAAGGSTGSGLPFLLGEVGLDQVLGDRGAQVAVLVVLAEDHARDLRVVLGREEHEPAVVAQVAAAVACRLRGPGWR